MRKIRIKKAKTTIDFEGNRYSFGVWLVTDGLMVKEPDHYVYYQDGRRVEVKAAKIAGVMSHQTADRLLHNWPDVVSEVKPKKPKPEPEIEPEVE
jgi:hypothetical protein